jgi:hypothetical protein
MLTDFPFQFMDVTTLEVSLAASMKLGWQAR